MSPSRGSVLTQQTHDDHSDCRTTKPPQCFKNLMTSEWFSMQIAIHYLTITSNPEIIEHVLQRIKVKKQKDLDWIDDEIRFRYFPLIVVLYIQNIQNNKILGQF